MEFHAHLEILELEHALLEERLGEIFARIAARTSQLFDDVGEQQPADAEFGCEARQIEARSLLGERRGPLAAREIVGLPPSRSSTFSATG
jgi:hypothetical protein